MIRPVGSPGYAAPEVIAVKPQRYNEKAGWVGLGWVGLGWVGLGWVGLGWVGWLVGWLVVVVVVVVVVFFGGGGGCHELLMGWTHKLPSRWLESVIKTA